MLVISMRTRQFHGIKTSTIWMRPGNAAVLVLAVVLAAFSFSASAAFSIVSIVFAALTVLGAAVAVVIVAEVVAAAVVAVASLYNNASFIKIAGWTIKREAPATACRGFSSKGQTYETNLGT